MAKETTKKVSKQPVEKKTSKSTEVTQTIIARRKRPTTRTLLVAVLVVVLAGGLVYTGMRYQQSREEVARLSDPTEAAKAETDKLIQQVSNLVELPQNETPTVATVADKDKLAAQPFFVNAQNGDKVLIYTQAKKAVLYRPSTNKVIEVAPVNLGEDTPKGTSQQ